MRILRSDSVSAGALILLALMLLLLPLRWLLAAFVAAIFHELCHFAAVWLCGGHISDFQVGNMGAVMRAEHLSRGKALFCILAGPLGGLLLLFTAKWFPLVAVCALCQSAYNLLPIEALDGGHALRCAAELLLSPRAAKNLCTWAERLCLLAIGVGAMYTSVILRLGFMPLLLALAIFVRKISLQTGAITSTIEEVL